MRLNTLTLALAMALAPSLSPAKGPVVANTGPSAQQLAIKHEKIVLPNGLTVLVHEDHSVPLVAMNL